LNLAEKFKREATVDVAADGVARALTIPQIPGLTTTYFVRLLLQDPAGHEYSRNFYWLSTEDDELNWAKTEWYYTPTTRHANLTGLAALPPTTVETAVTPATDGFRVRVRNTGRALAFQVRLKLADPSTGTEILPVYWSDNYFELLPGEAREVAVSYLRTGAQGNPTVTAEAWNTPRQAP